MTPLEREVATLRVALVNAEARAALAPTWCERRAAKRKARALRRRLYAHPLVYECVYD